MLLAVGAAFVSRVAKNFQDYYLNTVTQRTGAKIYNDGIEHSLALPYEVFEDQRSGETLGTLQKVRTSSETFINAFINVLFVSIIGFIFVTIYAAKIYWGVAVVYALTIPIIGGLSYALTAKVKKIQKIILAETTALAGSTTESLRNIELVKSLGLVTQEINRLNATTDKILKLELKKLRYIRSISFVQGTLINLMRTLILAFLLYLVFAKIVTFGQFFSLYIYSFLFFSHSRSLVMLSIAIERRRLRLNALKRLCTRRLNQNLTIVLRYQILHTLRLKIFRLNIKAQGMQRLRILHLK